MTGADDTDGSALGEVALLIRAFQLSRMLSVAATLDIAGRIEREPRAHDELARECGAQPEMLLRLLRALAAFGIFTVDGEGRVGHSKRSRVLCRDASPTLHHAARYWTSPGNWAAWGALEHTVRTGEAAFEAVFAIPNFEYLKRHPEEAALFDRFMQHSPDDRHEAVADAYDFSRIRSIADVGGGNGALLAVLLRRYPQLEGVLLDSESAVAAAEQVLGPLKARCAVVAGDFFRRVPPARDAYVLSQILHDWNDESCLRILANCRSAMRGDSRLLVIERVLEEGGNPVNHLSDMDMMVLFPGAKERTLAEYRQLFAQAGFAPGRGIATRSPFSIIETVPAV